MRQIVLDTETTGLKVTDGHRIIEIGCVELVKRKFTGNNYHVYINPDREIDAGAVKIHGITHAFLADKPRFEEIFVDFFAYIKDAELIIHNAPFDTGFLDHEFKQVSRKNRRVQAYCSIIDTLVMARKKHPGQRNSLDALCKRYQIDNRKRKLHGALLDAELLADVYLAMTGGQSDFFAALVPADQEKMGATKQGESDKTRMQKQGNVVQGNQADGIDGAVPQGKVLEFRADEKAQVQHRQYLRALEKKNKACVWDLTKGD